jgi:hypothetical protein
MTHDEMMDQLKATVLKNIKKHGWHCAHVIPDADTVGFLLHGRIV